ncbi:hypothetical protein AMELA_G00201350 [Ameiurus melas]|uniref:Uncharacterized protein n=1 Tax=Ameiurus melas TaxID=219545 RepID=A0A7J6A9D3_AMEME|nr:hypothetical protein AMELA_G00201350 [Ameiurus melas]
MTMGNAVLKLDPLLQETKLVHAVSDTVFFLHRRPALLPVCSAFGERGGSGNNGSTLSARAPLGGFDEPFARFH